jgi:hypothetical protein
MNAARLLLLALIAAPAAHAFDSFDGEAEKLRRQLGCLRPKVSAPVGSDGRLWGIGGAHETVKMFINEDRPGGGRVRNVKFIWNDYHRDVGQGTHLDKDLARAWVASLATIYAPHQVDAVLRTFAGDRGAQLVDGGHVLSYRYHRGPSATERMIVVTWGKP